MERRRLDVHACKNCKKGFPLWYEGNFAWDSQKRRRSNLNQDVCVKHHTYNLFCSIVMGNSTRADRLRTSPKLNDVKKKTKETLYKMNLLPSVLITILCSYLFDDTQLWKVFVARFTLYGNDYLFVPTQSYLWFVPTQSPLTQTFVLELPCENSVFLNLTIKKSTIIISNINHNLDTGEVNLQFWRTKLKSEMKWNLICPLPCPSQIQGMKFCMKEHQILLQGENENSDQEKKIEQQEKELNLHCQWNKTDSKTFFSVSCDDWCGESKDCQMFKVFIEEIVRNAKKTTEAEGNPWKTWNVFF